MEKIYNLKNKTPEEVIKIYKNIVTKSQIQNKIWDITNNYEKAMQIYENYIKANDDKNE